MNNKKIKKIKNKILRTWSYQKTVHRTKQSVRPSHTLSLYEAHLTERLFADVSQMVLSGSVSFFKTTLYE